MGSLTQARESEGKSSPGSLFQSHTISPKSGILLLGPPCAGKSTVSQYLLDIFQEQLASFSAGKLIRDVGVKAGKSETLTVQEELVNGYLKLANAGGLMPSELVSALMQEHLQPGGGGNAVFERASSIIFDGVIKRGAGLQPFLNMLENLHKNSASPVELKQLVHIDVPQDVLMERMRQRVEETNATGEKPRADDSESIFKKRLEAYLNTINPVIEYFEREGQLTHITCDATTKPQEVADQLITIMKGLDQNLSESRDHITKEENRMKESEVNTIAVIGLQWGDEGKGKATDMLAQDSDIVVRFNGGANAGHSLKVGDLKFATHLMPSGILNPNILNVIANGVVMDPWQLLIEIEELKSLGIEITANNLRISSRTHIVMSYHKDEDALNEAMLAKSNGEDAKIGTTKRGIGPAYKSKADRSSGIRFCDLYNPKELKKILELAVRKKNAKFRVYAEEFGLDFDAHYDADILYKELLEVAEQLRKFRDPEGEDTASFLHRMADEGKTILFEGANATMLDMDHGTYPFVTSSNSSALGISTGAGFPPNEIAEIIGIMKAYTTRIGGGHFVTELPEKDPIAVHIREIGHEYGTTTKGVPRRCGWLDLAVVKYAGTLTHSSLLKRVVIISTL